MIFRNALRRRLMCLYSRGTVRSVNLTPFASSSRRTGW
jgi:hypothetical protein